jgi:hypothetical protein
MRNIIIVLGIFLLQVSAFAADVKTSIPTAMQPTKFVGLLVSKQGVLEKTGLELQGLENPKADAVVPVGFTENSESTLVTTMYLTGSGEIKFTPLKSVSAQERADKYSSLKKCTLKMPQVKDSQLAGNIGSLQSLLEVRRVRRDFLKLEIASKLRGDYLEKLQNLEKGLGLSADIPLSADLPPAELNIRLFRILSAVKNYKQPQVEEF